MNIEQFWKVKEHSGASISQLQLWQDRYGLTLPNTFIKLYLVQNGGRVDATLEDDEYLFDFAYRFDGDAHECMAPLSENMTWQDYQAFMRGEEIAEDEIEESGEIVLGDDERMVPFAGDGHWFLCLDWNTRQPDDEPLVTYIDTECGSGGKILLADSFDAYLGRLQRRAGEAGCSQEKHCFEDSKEYSMLLNDQSLYSIQIDCRREDFFERIPDLEVKSKSVDMGGLMRDCLESVAENIELSDRMKQADKDLGAGVITEEAYDRILYEDDGEDKDSQTVAESVRKTTVSEYFEIRLKNGMIIDEVSAMEVLIIKFWLERLTIPCSCNKQLPFSIHDFDCLRGMDPEEMVKRLASLVLSALDNIRSVQAFYKSDDVGGTNVSELQQVDHINSDQLYCAIAGIE